MSYNCLMFNLPRRYNYVKFVCAWRYLESKYLTDCSFSEPMGTVTKNKGQFFTTKKTKFVGI